MDALNAATKGMPGSEPSIRSSSAEADPNAGQAHPALAKGKAAAQACGEFVMALRHDPSCDQDQIDVAAKELRKAIMDTLACLKQRR